MTQTHIRICVSLLLGHTAGLHFPANLAVENESTGHHLQAPPIKHLHASFHFLSSLLLLNGENSEVLEVSGDGRRKEPGFPQDHRNITHQARTRGFGFNVSQM